MEATQQPPAPAGERGSHPLRRAQFALGKLFDRWWRRSAKLLEPGVVMAQKQAGTTSFVIWVGAVVEGLLAEEVHAKLVVTPADGAAGAPGTTAPIETPIELVWYCIDSEREESGQADGIRFFHGHAAVLGLDPGTVYAVRLADGPLGPTPGPSGRPVQIRARTLPKPLTTGDRLRVFAASCYDGDTDSGNRLDRAFTAVFGQDVPDLTLLLGDQVYADAPAWRYALLSRHTPRTGLLMKYWRSWGMQTRKGRSRPGLSGVLGSGPTYFLPDDHEFWNNWPNRTVTAKHSIGKIRAAIRNGRERELALAPETDEPMVRPPHDPRFPPTNPYQQNYLPVHPAEWDAWALASFELFGSFQTKAYGPPSRGEMDPRPTRDSPPEPGTEDRIHEPRHPVVQVVEVDPVTIALLDTRTRRTRRARHPYHSGFADREFVEEVLDAAERAPVFVLALSQPLLLPASWLRDRDRRERFSLFGDIGMQDYWYQYQWFWTELVRRRDRRPTITVGGDIHRSYLALARSPELNLLEVVASPMSLVTGGRLLELPAKLAGLVGAGSGLDYEASDQGFLPLWKVTAGPRGLPFVDGEARSLGSLPQNRPGFAGLVVEKLDGDAVRLDVRLFDRDRVVEAVDGGEPIDATIVKRFRLDYGVQRGITEEDAAGPGLPAAR